ncbi:MAG: cation transporter [Candidatus Zixiibacteriota bacterium]
MRKVFGIGVACMAVLALAAMPAFAGGAECASKASADKAACTAAHGTDGKMISSDGKACPSMGATKTSADAKACCAAHGGKMASMTPEECAKMCGYTGGKCEMVSMSVKGMTCGGCESSVTAALEKVPGVVKVVSISYKDGTAMVCVDPAKCQKDGLTSAVSNKGYEAAIIPAVATTGAEGHGKVCSPEEKAACAAKGAKAEKTTLEDSK